MATNILIVEDDRIQRALLRRFSTKEIGRLPRQGPLKKDGPTRGRIPWTFLC